MTEMAMDEVCNAVPDQWLSFQPQIVIAR